jgi:predicted O-methyltransferase YrrM
MPSSVDSPPQNLKQRLARVLPHSIIEWLDGLVFRVRSARIRATHAIFGRLGFNIVKRKDYYSTLPVLSELRETRKRWDRPSALAGVQADVGTMAKELGVLAEQWEAEYLAVTGDYLDNTRKGFGPGYPQFDSRTLYYFLREHKPRRYLEVGSGLSTYYASLAGARNEAEGDPLGITCIEPYPFEALKTLPGFDLVEGFVQDTPLEVFESLESGDVLFIDSSHALKVDSDVAYLFLEVLPRIKPGVFVHIHDVPFPFNTPYPADTWVFGERWPVYWNEAMVVQAFLAFNTSFEVLLSVPMIRHEDEEFLVERFPDYVRLADDPNPPSSLWIQRLP